MNLAYWKDYFHRNAEQIRTLSRDLGAPTDGDLMAKDLHQIAEDLAPNYEARESVPTAGICPECDGAMIVHQRFTPCSVNYKAGYRAVWRCLNPDCGEMEVR